MSEGLSLFGDGDPGSGTGGPAADGPRGPGSGEGDDQRSERARPLAARMRPRILGEVRGQDHLLGEGRPLRTMLQGGDLASCILWGPPGSGKTTLARLLALRADAAFVSFSAVTEGVARVREVIAEARIRLQASGRRTILFCDEIHRFNKAQQDAFLPHVEDGTVILVGATTENPSFEVNRPLLSRAPVFVLKPLTPEDLMEVLALALDDRERGLGGLEVEAEEEALELLARGADGDARRALGALEAGAALVGRGGRLTAEVAAEALQHRFAIYDKSGEEHFNLISALHKAVRGSDPDGALYWLARMVQGGEDPLYLARRLVRMASEDIGLADPRALEVTVAAWQAYHFLGSPEGELALAEAALYLATAPKSNRAYRAWGRARELAEETGSAPVPLHIRNAPTPEMKEWGYGEGYRYDPDEPDGIAPQTYLPEGARGRPLYEPTSSGYEDEVARRLAWWAERRGTGEAQEGNEEARRAPDSGDESDPEPGGHEPGDAG